MNRRTCLTTLAGTAAAATLTHALPTSTNASDADRQITRAAAAALAMQRRDWEQGTLAQAFLECGNDEQVILLTRAAMVQAVPDGRLGVVVSGGTTDPAMGGEAYLRAAELTGDPRMKQAADGLLDWILRHAPRAPDGTLYHVFDGPQVWSDGFHGAPPFLAATGHYDRAIAQIEGFRQRLWDPQKKLLAHIWTDSPEDSRGDAGRGTAPSPHTQVVNKKEFWGGGNGWAAAGLARVIRSLTAAPKYDADRTRLIAFLRDLLDGCLACQRPDGLFHDMVDRPDTFVETNMAQMVAFAIYTSVAGGWLPASYVPAAARMRAATRAKMDKFGYIEDVSSAPNFDRPGISTEGQAFHMMMEAAAKKLETKR